MLPGGMMPVTQLVAMMRSSPPQHAAGLLMAMPVDRLHAVLGALKPVDLARLVVGAKPNHRADILALLSHDQIIGVLRTVKPNQAAVLLSGVSRDLALAVIANLPTAAAAVLLNAMDVERRKVLLAGMDPVISGELLVTMYEHGVAHALGRTNATISYPPDGPRGTLLVRAFDRLIVVIIRYGDYGVFPVRGVQEAEHAATWARASAALAVTRLPLSDEANDYLDAARAAGRPLDAITWLDERHDGLLQRSLVGLVR